MTRLALHMVGVALFSCAVGSASSVLAVAPNALQNAYWRFEEGTANSQAAPGDSNGVTDSINANHMKAHDAGVAPTYVTEIAPTPLRSGLANTLALNFIATDNNNDGIVEDRDDLYTDVKDINNGMIGGTVAPGLSGFTLEAAFKPNSLGRFQGIVGREGQPSGSNEETLELKIRDSNYLQIEQFDRAGTRVDIQSVSPMVEGNWYYTAVVNTGIELQLWLDSNDGNGYVLQGTTGVNGALYQGSDDWDHAWSIGRGDYNGVPADWFNGIIDEVRLTNEPLSPDDFLFAPPSGDYNDDEQVDSADYVIWRKTNVFGDQGYTSWRSHFGDSLGPGEFGVSGTVPEPTSIFLTLLAFAGMKHVRKRCRK